MVFVLFPGFGNISVSVIIFFLKAKAMSSDKLFPLFVLTSLLWVAIYYECLEKLVIMLGYFLMINLRWSRCMFCRMRVNVEKRTIRIAPASILCKVLAFLLCIYGTEIGSCTTIAAAVF